LLKALDAPLGDASEVIGRLYGEPSVTREELVRVRAEGIKEWQHWRQSLEALGSQSWG